MASGVSRLRPVGRIRLGVRVLPIRARIVAGLLAVAVPLAGCAEFDNPAAAHGLTRRDLVAQLAAQLGGSASLTFAATYQLAGGRTATIAQAQMIRRYVMRQQLLTRARNAG